jgi:hypothetical protein
VAWVTATASGSSNCVQAALIGEAVLVRDSKQPDGPVLTFTATEWDCFLDGVRGGEFDRSRLQERENSRTSAVSNS